MKSLTAALCLLAAAQLAQAATLPVEPFPSARSWPLPGGINGGTLNPGVTAVTTLSAPPLSDKEASLPGEWRGIVGVDVFGTTTGQPGGALLELVDPDSNAILASAAIEIATPAPGAFWSPLVSSEHPGEGVDHVFDADPTTDWHSNYRGEKTPGPHWIGAEFLEPQSLHGLRYLPRQEGFTNGVAKDYKVEIRRPGKAWETVAEGSTDRDTVADQRQPLTVRFEQPVEVEAFRFVIVSDWSGGGFGTAAGLEPLGIELPPPGDPVPASRRALLEIPPDTMAKLATRPLQLRVSAADGATVVLGSSHFCRVHEKPTSQLFGRSNGGLGPDQLGAGLLGFTALTEHQQTVLSVMSITPTGPAGQAGLTAGDAIVSIDGIPLAPNDLAPGWNWFYRSHEALLGRASEDALAKGRAALALGVLRAGKVEQLELVLPRQSRFTTLDPATDPAAAEMLSDLIAWTRANQHADGSWSRDIKRTTFAALALMSHDLEAHHDAVARAIDWSLQQYDSPEKHGNLGFWGGAFMGILYAEWHLQTGDERVLAPMADLRDWAHAGHHICVWDVPALGHGPPHLPYGNKALVAPACHLLVFEALAMRCGIGSKLWELLMPYMEMAWSDPADGGHGALGYNRSAKDLEEFWSRTGLFAVAAHLRGERHDMRDAMVAIMRQRHPWLRNSHAYGEPGGALGLLALNLVDPEIYSEVIREYTWWFSLAWQPGYGLRFSTPHMGAPYMGEDDLMNVIYALVLQAPKRNLHLTGKLPDSP